MCFHLLGQCFDYQNLTDSWRKIGTPGALRSESYGIGYNWHRFVEPAGTKLSNKDIGFEACGTKRSGWLDGPDPTVVGENKQERVCFSGYPNSSNQYYCRNYAWIWVTLCKDNSNEKFFVYKLKKPEQSNAAYCAEGEKLTLNDDDNLEDS